MRKGESTKTSILNQAVRLASQIGLEGLSIGSLAEQLALSKSGLFAHFRSKEALQIQVLEAAAQQFSDKVARPAVQAPRGVPRLRALFEMWLRWGNSQVLPGGCIFIAASAELDDRPGPVRNKLVVLQQQWEETRRRIAQTCIDEGHFRKDVSAAQVGFEVFGIMMSFHHASRLLKDPRAETLARNAFEALVRASSPPAKAGKS